MPPGLFGAGRDRGFAVIVADNDSRCGYGVEDWPVAIGGRASSPCRPIQEALPRTILPGRAADAWLTV